MMMTMEEEENIGRRRINVDKIMKDSMNYVVNASKEKSVTEIKKELEYVKNIIHNDIIKILNRNSHGFMHLPSNLNLIEKMMPILKKEVEISKIFVNVLLSEIYEIHKNTYLLMEDKMNITFIKNVLKNNVNIEQLMSKLSKEMKLFKKSKQFFLLSNMYDDLLKLSSNFEQGKKDITLERISINNADILYFLSQRIYNIAKGIWKIKALLYNNYKTMCKISSSLLSWNNLVEKYGDVSECNQDVIHFLKNNSYKYMNESLNIVITEINMNLQKLSYVFLKIVKLKDVFLMHSKSNIRDHFIFNQCLYSILTSSYSLNMLDVFTHLFREIFIDTLEQEPFESYDSFLGYVKKNILEDENIAEINKLADEIDPSSLFFTRGILQKLLEIIKRKFPEIFILTYCDTFIENYIKTWNFLNEIKKKKKKYEQFIIYEHANNFLKNFERDAYTQYILNVLENKINENCKNVILFDKKFIFDDKFYWLKETINLIKIFKILFTSKYYIPSSLPNYLSFIFKHFKKYIDNIENFLFFLRENRSTKISTLDKGRFNWSPTLSYNSIGFVLSDLTSLRRIFKIRKNVKNIFKNGIIRERDTNMPKQLSNSNNFVLPERLTTLMGDVPIWIFTKILSYSADMCYEEHHNSYTCSSGEDNTSSSSSTSSWITSSCCENMRQTVMKNIESPFLKWESKNLGNGITLPFHNIKSEQCYNNNEKSHEFATDTKLPSSIMKKSFHGQLEKEKVKNKHKTDEWKNIRTISRNYSICHKYAHDNTVQQNNENDTHSFIVGEQFNNKMTSINGKCDHTKEENNPTNEENNPTNEENNPMNEENNPTNEENNPTNEENNPTNEENNHVKVNSENPMNDKRDFIDEKDELHELGRSNKNSLREKQKRMKIYIQIYKEKNKKKLINDINCISGFLKTLSKIIHSTQKDFEQFFINKMYQICSSFLVYLHSLLTIYKMINKQIPDKPNEHVEKVLLPLISFKTFYEGVIAQSIIEDIINKIVDKISDYYLEEIKNIMDVKIQEQNKCIMKLNLRESLKDGDIPYEEKIQRQIFLDVCHYEKLCKENFKISRETSASMNALVNSLFITQGVNLLKAE
ncbi:hypothetical protein, conserved [Plasmodium gonderi]|uniref:COG complex component COG2 C-terminal domain-containing protein n=1 Tax=Plasmodium gonderi TaxID=77519 RepID=A0A1Y1JJV5_PLAGO|nr:hypothetical protein, conserved [Plasmodium gonderi]GAW81072.1 hypothetical protein, conserved [Plasmodium gonderi]